MLMLMGSRRGKDGGVDGRGGDGRRAMVNGMHMRSFVNIHSECRFLFTVVVEVDIPIIVVAIA